MPGDSLRLVRATLIKKTKMMRSTPGRTKFSSERQFLPKKAVCPNMVLLCPNMGVEVLTHGHRPTHSKVQVLRK